MSRLYQLTLLLLLLLIGSNFGLQSVSVPTPKTSRDLGTDVLQVFSAKCASCHGPDLKHPEGRFGYALDLSKIRANPEFIIPGDPNASEIWHLVHNSEMPPSDSDSKLTEAEKSIIHDWIATGAPNAATAPAITY